MFEEFEELIAASNKSDKLNEAMASLPEGLSTEEYLAQLGKQIDVKVIESQTPLYETEEEAKEASEKPELQMVDQFGQTVVKKYLKLE